MPVQTGDATGAIHGHYTRVDRSLKSTPGERVKPWNNTVVVLVGRVHKGVLQALQYAKSLNPSHLVAVSVVTDEDEDAEIRRQWAEYSIDVPLETVYSPYRELTKPVRAFIDELDARYSNDVVTIVIPEFVVNHWWNTCSTTRVHSSSRADCCSAGARWSPPCRTTSNDDERLKQEDEE